MMRTIAQTLRKYGLGEPLRNAEILLANLLGVSRSYLYAYGERELTIAEQNQLDSQMEKSAQGVPIAYLTGHQEFWSLDLQVTPDTLIPRSETELLVELVLAAHYQQSPQSERPFQPRQQSATLPPPRQSVPSERLLRQSERLLQHSQQSEQVLQHSQQSEQPLQQPPQSEQALQRSQQSKQGRQPLQPLEQSQPFKVPRTPPLHVADLGTGSGAVALALGRENPDWQIIATDISQAALEIAKANASRLQIPNVSFYQGVWCDALPNQTLFDYIVSNPPYIAEGDPHLQAPVLRYEPRIALIAGEEGLKDLHHIIHAARTHLNTNGWLFLEHGFQQGERVRRFFLKAGYNRVATYRDLAGLERVTTGQWQGIP